MGNIFSKAKTAKDDGIEDDYLGGSYTFDSDIYEASIKACYMREAASSKAMSVNFLLDVNGKELRQQIWVSNRNGDFTYKDKKTKKDKNLPGYNMMNSVALLVLGMELGDLEVEERTMKIYDVDAKKEIPQAVNCFVELHDKDVLVAVQKQVIDKTKKNDSTNEYEPTGETREVNEIIKFFAPEKRVTISEVSEFIKGLGGDFDEIVADGDLLKGISKMPEGSDGYAEAWLDKNQGSVYNKAKGASDKGKSFGDTKKSGGGSSKGSSNLFDD